MHAETGGAVVSHGMASAAQASSPASADGPSNGFIVEARIPGYAHVRLSGTCAAGTTKQQVADRFYHDYFGGREAEVWTTADGVTHWSCVRHTD